MKKFLKIFAILLLLLLLAAVAVPYFFKGRIVEYIKQDINRTLTARVDFGKTSLTLFRSFPDLYVEINDLSVVNADSVFRDVPLARIGRLGLRLDLSALWKGRKEVKDILLENADFVVLVRPDGKANYDIVRSQDSTETETSSSALEMHLKHYTARNIRLLYDDRSMDMRLYLAGFDHEGSTDISGDVYTLRGQSTADTLDVRYGGTGYLVNARVQLADTIVMRDGFQTFEFRNISGTINDLPLHFEGSMAMKPNDDIAMDLHFGTAQNSLAKLMSLIPAGYMPPLPRMDIHGLAKLDGSVKGVYNEHSYPAYHIALDVDKGRIKGKDLPGSLDGIRVQTRVDFPGGADLDATVIDMPVIAFRLNGNPAQGHLQVHNPMTDPLVNTAFKANLNLGDFGKALPLESVRKLQGRLQADFALNARVSDMEKQRTERIRARGFFNLSDFVYEADSLPYPVRIARAETHITPLAWKLDKLQMQAGRSDFDLRGEAVNYLAYLTGKDSTLRASFQGRSHFIDANELTGGASGASTSDTTQMQAPRIPANLDLQFAYTADRMRYKDMDLHNLKADVRVANRKAELRGVLLQALGGQMDLTGTYDTSGEKPYTSLQLQMRSVEIDKTASSLTFFKAYAPILQQIRGQMNLALKTGLQLDENLNPILKTTDATGDLSTSALKPERADFFRSAASVLKLKALEKPEIKSAKAHFAIAGGTLTVQPFDFKVNGMKSTLGGKVMLDQTLDLQWNLEIPVEKLGAQAQAWMQNFQGQLSQLGIPLQQIKTVYVTLQITGDLQHPRIRPVFRKGAGMQGLINTVKDTVTAVVKQEVKQVVDTTARYLDAQAQALIAQAERQGDSIIAQARKAAERIRKEADKRAKEIEAKASNPLEKFAAKKAADKIRKEAGKRANQLIRQAEEKKKQWVEAARQKAVRLRQRSDSLVK